MITEHQELARQLVDDRLRDAQARALRRADRDSRRAERAVSAPRRELAGALRRLADRLEPQPQPRRTGLPVTR